MLMAGTVSAISDLRHNQRSDIDLTKVPIVNIVTALVDKLPVDADVKILPDGLQDLSKLDVKGILSCVVDELPVDVSLSIFPVPTSTAPSFTTITRTHTVIVAPTDAPCETIRERSTIDLHQVPIANLIAALVDKLPVDADVKALPDGLQDLSTIDLQSILSCVVDKLPVESDLSVLS